jgi:hypothetical protein
LSEDRAAEVQKQGEKEREKDKLLKPFLWRKREGFEKKVD